MRDLNASIMNLSVNIWRFFMLFACIAVTHTEAQNLPNAGSIQQQINREREVLIPREIHGTEVSPLEVKKRIDGVKVMVQSFKFVGNTILHDDELQKIASPFTGRLLAYHELEMVSRLVADRYRELGFVVKTSLPAQDIKDGVLTIEVLEARFGRVVVEPFSSTRVSANRILKTLEASQKSGEKVNILNIDKALAILTDLSGVQIQGSLVEGDEPGFSNLVVTLNETSLIHFETSTDNSGSRSTGANRLSTTTALSGLLGLGDQLALSTLNSSGTQYLRLSQSMPLGYGGTKLGLNISHLNYHLVTQDYAALLAKGSSDGLGLEVNYPWVLSRVSNVNVLLSLEGKHLLNQSQNTVASDYVSQMVNLGLMGSTLASSLSHTRSSFRIDWVNGWLDLNKSPSQSADANTTKTAGRFGKFKYFLSRDQDLGHGLSFYTSLVGQWANKNLDSSEKFYLGGVNGVRAYPSNEAGGAWGQLLSVELRSRIGSSSTWSTFYDYGRVLINPRNDFAGASPLNQYALKGYGFAYSYSFVSGASLKATISRRASQNPNPSTTGNDQDGSLVKNRIWVNAFIPF